MLSYQQLIDGYESPTSSDQNDILIDQYCQSMLHQPLPINKYSVHPFPRKNISQRPKKQQFRPQSNSHITFDKKPKRQRRRDHPAISYKKQYTFLSAVEMQRFQQDLIHGDLSKDDLCNKYNISTSTTARFIRNFKAFGKISVKKSEVSTKDLIDRFMIENPGLRQDQIKYAFKNLQGRMQQSGLGASRFSNKG